MMIMYEAADNYKHLRLPAMRSPMGATRAGASKTMPQLPSIQMGYALTLGGRE
jgi:hypothetical protein